MELHRQSYYRLKILKSKITECNYQLYCVLSDLITSHTPGRLRSSSVIRDYQSMVFNRTIRLKFEEKMSSVVTDLGKWLEYYLIEISYHTGFPSRPLQSESFLGGLYSHLMRAWWIHAEIFQKGPISEKLKLIGKSTITYIHRLIDISPNTHPSNAEMRDPKTTPHNSPSRFHQARRRVYLD